MRTKDGTEFPYLLSFSLSLSLDLIPLSDPKKGPILPLYDTPFPPVLLLLSLPQSSA